jgi:hypothetical protein
MQLPRLARLSQPYHTTSLTFHQGLSLGISLQKTGKQRARSTLTYHAEPTRFEGINAQLDQRCVS